MTLSPAIVVTSHSPDSWSVRRVPIKSIDFYQLRHNRKRQRMPFKPTYQPPKESQHGMDRR